MQILIYTVSSKSIGMIRGLITVGIWYLQTCLMHLEFLTEIQNVEMDMEVTDRVFKVQILEENNISILWLAKLDS